MEIVAYKLPTENGYPMGWYVWDVGDSFRHAILAFADVAPDPQDYEKWEFIQIVPKESLELYPFGNNGAQAWRHIETGYAIPDYCRQTGGCPEIWTREEMEWSTKVEIAADSPIFDYIVE